MGGFWVERMGSDGEDVMVGKGWFEEGGEEFERGVIERDYCVELGVRNLGRY